MSKCKNSKSEKISLNFFDSRMRLKGHLNPDLGGPSVEKKSTNKPYSFQKNRNK